MPDTRSLSDEQPPPTHNDHPACWDLVIEDLREAKFVAHKVRVEETLVDMRERDQVGFERYGTRLQPFNGRDSLIDAYQEGLDLCVYLRTALYELETENKDAHQLRSSYEDALKVTANVRAIIWNRDGK